MHLVFDTKADIALVTGACLVTDTAGAAGTEPPARVVEGPTPLPVVPDGARGDEHAFGSILSHEGGTNAAVRCPRRARVGAVECVPYRARGGSHRKQIVLRDMSSVLI